MRCTVVLICAASLGLAAGCGRATPREVAAPAPAVELHVVSYDALGAAVRAQRGKVVVVDVWGEF